MLSTISLSVLTGLHYTRDQGMTSLSGMSKIVALPGRLADDNRSIIGINRSSFSRDARNVSSKSPDIVAVRPATIFAYLKSK
jgi:hypothetical protein